VGRRREQRLVINLRVRVSGVDASGNAFSQDAETVDISRYGCRLRWISCLKGPGDVVEVRYKKEKARFKVAWIGEPGGRREGQVGLRVLDDKYIWGVMLGSPKRDEFVLPEEALPPPPPAERVTGPIKVSLESGWTGEERRAAPRYRCPGDVEVTESESGASVKGLLSDISEGGCYVDMMAPLASGTQAQLRVSTTEATLEAQGVVRASHPAMGMGVQFTEMTAESRRQLDALVGGLAAQFAAEVAGTAPPPEADRYNISASELEIQPLAAPLDETESAATATAGMALPTPTFETQVLLDALLQLLYAKGVITPEEFQEALQKAASSRGH
jgi:hypothetical protein